MCRSHRCPATVVEPDVERHAERDVVEPGADAGDRVAVVDRDRDRPAAVAERALQPGQHDRVDVEVLEVPLLAERFAQPLQVARSGRARSGSRTST